MTGGPRPNQETGMKETLEQRKTKLRQELFGIIDDYPGMRARISGAIGGNASVLKDAKLDAMSMDSRKPTKAAKTKKPKKPRVKAKSREMDHEIEMGD